MKKTAILTLALALCAGAATAANDGYTRSLSTGVAKQLKADPAGRRASVPLKVATLAEQGIDVPFTHTLGKNEIDIMNLYTVIDANGDGKTWKPGGFTAYSVCMKPADTQNAMDDWMISPVINLQGGKTYTFSIEMRHVLGSGQQEKLEVCIGQGVTVADMTQTVATFTETSGEFTKHTAEFTVAADGQYNIGLHAISEFALSGNLGACNLSIAESTGQGGDVTAVVPPAAGTIEYEVFPFGELKAHVTYTAPTKDVEGGDLDHIDHVTIINRWYEKFEYDDVIPGSQIKLDVDLYDKYYNNRIQATAYLKDANGNLVAGEEVLVKDIYAGYDYPLAPENVKAVASADHKSVTLTWDPVTSEKGEMGGYVDTSNITYYIFDAFGSYFAPAIATTKESTITFDYSDLAQQDFFAYQVTASYVHDGDEYASLAGNSNVVTAGPLIDMPFKESFADARFQSIWLVDPESSYGVQTGTVPDNYLQTNAADPDAEPEYLNSQDGDNGFFYFLPMEKDDLYGLQSLSVSLSGAKHPVLDFYAQGKGSVIDVLVARDGGELQLVKTIDFKAEPTDGWTLIRTDLAEYKDAAYVSFELRMRAIHNDDEYTWSLPIDNIQLRDLVDNDLSIESLTAPSAVKVDDIATISARVVNVGTKASAPATAVLYANGEMAAQAEVDALEPDGATTVTFNRPIAITDPATITFKVELESEVDENPANNQAETTVTVIYPEHPTVDAPSAIANGNSVKLTWNAASIEGLTESEEYFEDFENPDYEPLTISDFGEWTMIDFDGEKTYTFLKDTKNPYRTQPMAYQLYNPVLAGVPQNYLIDCEPHSGSQMLVAWSATSYNMNLLISPKLSGEAQTITFWAKSFSIAYGETFTMYYSTTGKEVADFKKLGDSNGLVPEDWTEFSFELPEGTTYFAIMHDSYDTYALYLDDISFKKGSVLPADTQVLGYDVYRNGEKVNDAPVAECEYTDVIEATEDGTRTFTYQISVVYNNAVSRLSEGAEVSVTLSRISAIDANADTEAIYYSIDGRIVPAGRLTPGIYIRRTADRQEKVIIK